MGKRRVLTQALRQRRAGFKQVGNRLGRAVKQRPPLLDVVAAAQSAALPFLDLIERTGDNGGRARGVAQQRADAGMSGAALFLSGVLFGTRKPHLALVVVVHKLLRFHW
jgi:hypothetical protein